jgi:hypothetical protein
MGWFLDKLRGRKKREAEEALERLDRESEQGPEAARRFEEAARRIATAPKAASARQARPPNR